MKLENFRKKTNEIIDLLTDSITNNNDNLENFFIYNKDDKDYLIYVDKETGTIKEYNFYNTISNLKDKKSIRQYITNNNYKNFNDFYNILKDYFLNEKCVDNIVFYLDFKQKEKLRFEYIDNNLYIYKNFIEFKNIQIDNFDKSKYKYLVKTYIKKVFPYFNEFLDVITYNLFDKGLKRSYVYINAKSDWGKSFLMDLFGELNIGFETTIQKITKTPSPYKSEHFKDKILLMIDEFTVFKHELKRLTNKYLLEPKNKSDVEVQLFTKLFVSAELSTSFDDTTDEQIINRIIFYDMYNSNVKKVEDLKKENIDLNELHNYLKVYVKRYITKKIKYIQNNNINVVKKIDEIFKKRKMNVEEIEKRMKKMFLDFVDTTTSNDTNNKQFVELYLFNSKIIIDKENKKVYITKFPKFVEEYFKNELDEQSYKKFKYKFNKKTLERIYNFDYDRITINNNRDRFYIIDIDYLEKTIDKDLTKEEYKSNKLLKQIAELQEKLQTSEKEKKDLRENLLNIITKNFDYNKANLETLNNKELLEFLDDLIQTNLTNTIIKNNRNKPNNNNNNNIEEIGNFEANEIFDNDDEFPF